MKTNAKFWDKVAQKYAADPIADQAAYEHKLKETQKRYTRDSQLFEFGCGTGSTALYHAPNVKSVTAIDISSQMIGIAKDKQAAAGIENVEFLVDTLDTYQREPASFDMVMAHSILHLLEDPEMAIHKAYALLKPGGYFVSSTACLKHANPLIRIMIPLMQLIGKAPYVNSFSKPQLKTWHEAAGFEFDYVWHSKKSKMVQFVIAKKS